MRCDVSSEPSVKACVRAVFKRHGRLDAVVNNAGIATAASKPGEKLALADWNRRVATNLAVGEPVGRWARGARVIELANRLGFEAVDMGELAAARDLEPFAMAWIHLAIRTKPGRNFAFGLLTR